MRQNSAKIQKNSIIFNTFLAETQCLWYIDDNEGVKT